MHQASKHIEASFKAIRVQGSFGSFMFLHFSLLFFGLHDVYCLEGSRFQGCTAHVLLASVKCHAWRSCAQSHWHFRIQYTRENIQVSSTIDVIMVYTKTLHKAYVASSACLRQRLEHHHASMVQKGHWRQEPKSNHLCPLPLPRCKVLCTRLTW